MSGAACMSISSLPTDSVNKTDGAPLTLHGSRPTGVGRRKLELRDRMCRSSDKAFRYPPTVCAPQQTCRQRRWTMPFGVRTSVVYSSCWRCWSATRRA